jgi:hypothetical protein
MTDKSTIGNNVKDRTDTHGSSDFLFEESHDQRKPSLVLLLPK